VNVRDAIAARRSIRGFHDSPIPGEALDAILTAATQAPSGHNSQPWHFIVVQGDQRAEMAAVMRAGVANLKAQGYNIGSAERSARVMEQAPVTVFVFHTEGAHPWKPRSVDESFADLVNIQSIGAAIQNMLLAALDMGIGSLWICDVFYAYRELSTWLDEPSEMVAAVSLGYPSETPAPRPRKPLSEVVRRLNQK
jgi:F420 biosynthesis protein FbiB-like protein